MNIYDVIKNPVLSEKSMQAETDRQYIFQVDLKANKHQVREAVQQLYDVSVDHVRIMVVPAKTRSFGNRVFIRRPKWKKAIVTLPEGESINLYEGD